MIKVPQHALRFLEDASICPTTPCHSTESRKLAEIACKVVRLTFKAAKVEVFTEEGVSKYDPDRKRLLITLAKESLFAGETVYTFAHFILDVGMAVYLAEKVATGEYSRPHIRATEDGNIPIMYGGMHNKPVKMAQIIYRSLYPDTKRRRYHVNGSQVNLCNWNIHPHPFVSFFNMVRYDGKEWYLKLRTAGESIVVRRRTQESLIDHLRSNYDEYCIYDLDVAAREKSYRLHGDDISMVSWYAYVDRLVRWSPTADLSPYLSQSLNSEYFDVD